MSRFWTIPRLARVIGCRHGLLQRNLSYPNDPLTQPIDVAALRHPNVQRLGQSVTLPHSSETRLTRLENGLRVASQEAFGQYSTVGGEEITDLTPDVCFN